jgi:hypothetical protein
VNAKNFFAELKRRNVYKVAIAYIVAGWALSQGIAQVFSPSGRVESKTRISFFYANAVKLNTALRSLSPLPFQYAAK